jgi:hypothetical protein
MKRLISHWLGDGFTASVVAAVIAVTVALVCLAGKARGDSQSDARAALALSAATTRPAPAVEPCLCGASCPCAPGKRGSYCLCEPGACPMVKCPCHAAGGAADPEKCTCPSGVCACVYGSDCRSYPPATPKLKPGRYWRYPDGRLDYLGPIDANLGPAASEGMGAARCLPPRDGNPSAPGYAFPAPPWPAGATFAQQPGFGPSTAFCGPQALS